VADATPRLSLIAAVASNGVIGRDNGLPWRLPEDLKRFKALTLGHPVIMGRKTFDSIVAMLGKPLPGRTSIVVTRAKAPAGAGPQGEEAVCFAAGLDEAIAAAMACAGAGEIFVIGGAQIYALALPRAQRLYLTEVFTEAEGDAFFPPRKAAEWRELQREHGPETTPGLRYDFVTYERR
jgi:dihydrofolate reductase